MQDVLERLRNGASVGPRRTLPTIEEARAAFTPAGARHPIPEDVVVTEIRARGVTGFWLDAPGVDTDRALVFLHGGGYELGSLRSDGELAARVGRAARMRVLFVEYRLAPEHPFPAALDDALAVWQWLRADEGWTAGTLALVGDSAGGGLAVGLLVAIRDAGGAMPAAAVLMSPTVDLTGSGPSMVDRVAEDPISTPALLRRLASDYLSGADPRTPLASPLFAPLTGLPPLLIQAGTADLLLSDAQRLAKAATAAGVDTTLEVGDGLPHVYQLMLGTPEAASATKRIAVFLGERVGRPRLGERRPATTDRADRPPADGAGGAAEALRAAGGGATRAG